MEQDIYLDVYFSFNFLMIFLCFFDRNNYKKQQKIYRTIVSAIIGATYATIVMITEGMEIYQKYRNISKRYRGRPYKTVKNSFNLCCDSLCYGANCIWKIQCSYNDKKYDYYIHNYLYFKRLSMHTTGKTG